MISIIADNIISPLGMGSDANFKAVRSGKSELKTHEGAFGLPEPFCGSLLDREYLSAESDRMVGANDFSFFEKLCILTASQAIEKAGVNPSSSKVVFVLSTTKGNVDVLEADSLSPDAYIGRSAEKIARFFHNPNIPVIASNACISGVCAQIAAVRLLEAGKYDVAVVIGCDLLSKFIISGFQSFKALSAECCRPYDQKRTGLNLGEACGCMVLKTTSGDGEEWHYVGSSIHNDANHISGPSRTGEGAFRVLSDIMESVEISDLAFINAHGTATAYNDEMEAIAIGRAGLDELPLNGLKGYYGHTLGAAGVIETILSTKAVDAGIVLPTRGYSEKGTSVALNLSDTERSSGAKAFIKILSGFGGSNAGICYAKGGGE